MPEFARGFRLHPRSGPALDGAAFPSGRVFVLDDPEYGLATVAVSLEELLRGGYDSARIEWASATAGIREGADALDQRAAVLRNLSSSDYSDEAFAARELTEAAVRLRRTADEARPAADLTETPEDAARRFARRLHAVERLCSGRPGYHTITVKQLLTAMSDTDDEAQQQPCADHPDAPVIGGLCGGCTQYGDTLPSTPTVAGWTGEQQGPAVSGGDTPRPIPSSPGLPPEQPCTDPRHTGAIREQLSCSGPDPATT